VISVGSLSIRLRFGAPGASRRGRLTGEIARRAILANLILVCSASALLPFNLISAGNGPCGSLWSLWAYVDAVIVLTEGVLIVALVSGWRRTGRTDTGHRPRVRFPLLRLCRGGHRRLPAAPDASGAPSRGLRNRVLVARDSVNLLV